MNPWLEKHRFKLLPALVGIVALVAGIALRKPIAAWFSIGGHGAASAGSASPAPPASAPEPVSRVPALPPQKFSDAALGSLRTSLDAYEDIRARLAQDTTEGLVGLAKRTSQALGAADAALAGAPDVVRARVRAAAEAATAVGEANDLEQARVQFSELSDDLVSLVSADPRVGQGRHVYECPMVKGRFNKWIQRGDQLENPYMGRKMLTCGSESQWAEKPVASGAAHDEHAPNAGQIAYYTCPMHPSVKSPEPGKCPICGMDLVSVTKEELDTGVVRVDAARRQLIGVKIAKVEKRDIKQQIRTVGRITYDETRLVDVSLKFKGWIKGLVADSVGKRLRRGQTLFSVYSPDVFAAEQDFVLAASRGRGQDGGAFGGSSSLADAARLRLKLWDVPDGVIKKLEQGEPPQKYVPISSPASGFIVEKNVFEGSAVEPGMRLLRIANLDKVWIEAELYEEELPLVKQGMPAKVTLTYIPDKEFDGKVTFVYPYLDPKTRTGKVRIELTNHDVELKPEMFANVELVIDRGERLVVPDSAVIYSGPRRVVFVDIGNDRLEPRQIKVGLRSGDDYEVLDGLQEGETVVTSGNFLIAADSRLKSATEQWQ